MSAVSPSPTEAPQPIAASKSARGRWKFAVAIFGISCLAQAALWTMWWEDPTHFKMSILFVWPGALFLLLVWWTFFSGWSTKVRYRSVAVGFASLVAFLGIFRIERFDGDMVPTRLSWRWSPRRDQKVLEYLEQLKSAPSKPVDVAAEPLVADSKDWLGFRGPARDGIIHGMKLRTDWETRPPKAIWRHPVGHSWSSFSVVGDFAFTQEQRDDNEAVVAYRLSDGEQVWEHLDQARFPGTEVQGGTGPRATPQFDDGRLYTLGATGILNCLDARTGKLAWTTNILKDAGSGNQPIANLPWGMAGSPLIVDQMVIVIPGGKEGHSVAVAAYDKESGKKIWSGGEQAATYAGARLATLHGQRVVLAPLGPGLAAHSLADGRQLWFFNWTNSPSVCGAMPVTIGDDSILYGIGYGVGTVRIEIGSSNQKWSAVEKWTSNRFRPKFNDFVIRDGHAFGLDDGTLTCLDVESGAVKWKSGRYGYGQVLLVDDVLLIVSEKGTVSQIPAATTKPTELASFLALDEEGITWNQPVLVRGKLLIRNEHEAACFDLE